MRRCRERMRTNLGDGKAYAITDHSVIRAIIRNMNGKTACVRSDMVRCSIIKKQTESVGVVF